MIMRRLSGIVVLDPNDEKESWTSGHQVSEKILWTRLRGGNERGRHWGIAVVSP
jgi:hypothetical protein